MEIQSACNGTIVALRCIAPVRRVMEQGGGGVRARREYSFGAVQVWRPLCAGRRHSRLGQGGP